MQEQKLLKRIFDRSKSLSAEVVIGPGDDMAMLRPEGWSFAAQDGRLADGGVLLAVDQVVEGVHFSRDQASLGEIGRKAVARCLSDVAAMAGRPKASLATVVLPPAMTDDEAMELFDGMRVAADLFNAPIVGGDIAAHHSDGHPMSCTVTVMAEATDRGAVSRFGAQVGDLVCVTGALGGSLESRRHLHFQPRIGEGILLHAILSDRLHAMIDLSDGLGMDAGRMIAPDDSIRIVIDAERLPCHEGVDWRSAVSDGEDYELLCTVSPGELPDRILDSPLTVIGSVQRRMSVEDAAVVVESDGVEHDAGGLGWEHGS